MCKITYISYKRKIYRYILIFISMAKKSMELQIAILLAFGVSLIGFYTFDLKTSVGIIDALIITIKPYLLIIGILCFIPPIVNLLLQTFSKKDYDEQIYYQWLKFLTHVSFFLIVLFTLGWLWVLLLIGELMLKMPFNTSFVVSLILLYVGICVIDALLQKHIGIRWFYFFHWFKKD